ncbi:hypothetical protein NN6n1_11440 [Shinella zoogloeoides]
MPQSASRLTVLLSVFAIPLSMRMQPSCKKPGPSTQNRAHGDVHAVFLSGFAMDQDGDFVKACAVGITG